MMKVKKNVFDLAESKHKTNDLHFLIGTGKDRQTIHRQDMSQKDR